VRVKLVTGTSRQLRANLTCIVSVASYDCNFNALARDKEDQDDENRFPEEDKLKLHGCLESCYYLRHQTVKSKLGKLGEMAEDLQDNIVNCHHYIKEGLMMHKKSLLHT
jgi:hypothetical protein